MVVNPARGEAALTVDGAALTLRPSFEALVAAEGELGPLFALVERAAAGTLSLAEIAALFWHVVAERGPELTRERVGEAILEAGLAAVTPALRTLILQILQGR
ncbi:gene transfer agent family protein [Sphingomonas arantia]|uniref:Gene transfer agent family protein n=1 Tax=Sphingomonas arantia TaxID=1460676 RepID=A0ABW4U4R5_9SPHN